MRHHSTRHLGADASISRRFRAAFTLTEMLIAVAVLLVVILATSSIFSTAQRVSSLGEANSDILQQANAIERVLRNDFNRITRDGFFAVQCVGVPNDINFDNRGWEASGSCVQSHWRPLRYDDAFSHRKAPGLAKP